MPGAVEHATRRRHGDSVNSILGVYSGRVERRKPEEAKAEPYRESSKRARKREPIGSFVTDGNFELTNAGPVTVHLHPGSTFLASSLCHWQDFQSS